MKTQKTALIVLLLLALIPGQARAQSGEFRDARARISLGIGVFTFHGPANLLDSPTTQQTVHVSDPALALLGSFPLLKERVYFRFMLLFTNFETADGKRLVGTGSNDFLTKNLMVFEPSLVFPITSLNSDKLQPYFFTGFGGTVADAFASRRNIVDMPGTGIPGPERSAFHIPLGFGIDLAVSDQLSIYGEASWRLDMNYAFRNETDYDPHSTTLVMGGIRFRTGRSRSGSDWQPPDDWIPPDIVELPPWQLELEKLCPFADLTPVFFKEDSAELTDETLRVLDDNVNAMLKYPDCCLKIIGTMRSETEASAIRLANERSETVREYLYRKGISASRFSLEFTTIANPKCGTKPGDEPCPALIINFQPIPCTNLTARKEPDR